MTLTEDEEEITTKVLSELEERLTAHDRNRQVIQERLGVICRELRQDIEDMEVKVNHDLEELFAAEEERLQTLFNDINICLNAIYASPPSQPSPPPPPPPPLALAQSDETSTSTSSLMMMATSSDSTATDLTTKSDGTKTTKKKKTTKTKEKREKKTTKAKKTHHKEKEGAVAELMEVVTRAEVALQTEQTYRLVEGPRPVFTELYRLEGEKALVVKDIDLKGRKPRKLRVKDVIGEHIYLGFRSIFTEGEKAVLKGSGLDKLVDYRVTYAESNDNSNENGGGDEELLQGGVDYNDPAAPMPLPLLPLPDLAAAAAAADGGGGGGGDGGGGKSKSKSKKSKSSKRSRMASLLDVVAAQRQAEDASRHEQVLDREDSSFVPGEPLKAETTYKLRLRVEYAGATSEWSKAVLYTTPAFASSCGWRECREDVFATKKYAVAPENPRVVRALYSSPGGVVHGCAVVGRAALPRGKTTAWRLRVLASRANNAAGMEVGVAPFDVGRDDGCAHTVYGWYLRCEDFTLWSGPPQNYRMKAFALKKTFKEHLRVGGEVGIAVDLTQGTVAFEVNGKSLGVAYEGIPMNKPLVPVVVLSYKDDAIELIPC